MAEKDFFEISKKAMESIREMVKKEPLSIAGITKVGANWEVSVDVLERKSVPDTQDIIGRYLLIFGSDKQMISYKKTGTRHRGDVGEEILEEEVKK